MTTGWPRRLTVQQQEEEKVESWRNSETLREQTNQKERKEKSTDVRNEERKRWILSAFE